MTRRFFDSYSKSVAIVSMAAILLLSGCGDDTAKATNSPSGMSEHEVVGDHAIGNPDADVTVVEYASVVCPACANWHTSVYPDLKKKYIDSGKIRFIFREFPTQPENLARAGFLIANCADETKFMENISLQFQRQPVILRSDNIREEYINIAKAAGLSEDDFEACIANEEENAKYEAVVQGGIDAGVTSTPSFFINGEKRKAFKMEDFDEIILPLLGESVPEADAETASEATEK